jgi:RimJ/RimL family protein N-acetyltransferase
MLLPDPVIVLETARLRLRWFAPADADALLVLLNDPEWLRHIGDRGVRTRGDALQFVAERLVASYWRQGFGLWAIERRDDGAFAGVCGLVCRDGLPDLDLGYALLPAWRGHGFAREAGAACLDYAVRALGEQRVLAIVAPGNDRSQATLAALGMQPHGEVTLTGSEHASMLYEWRGPTPPPADDSSQLDALTARFFAAFTSRGDAPPAVLSLPHLFAVDAAITVPEADGATVVDVRGFVEPRAALLHGGRLRDFAEAEVAHETRVFGRFALRTLRYRKAGVLDGQPFAGTGTKSLQFVRTRRGWRIAALAWHDDA